MASKKITDLTAGGIARTNDLLESTQAPGTVPVSRRIAIQQLPVYGPDVPPIVASAYDDEFDGSVLDAKWVSRNFSGSTTAIVGQGMLQFKGPLASGINVRVLTQDAPVPPYTITAKFRLGIAQPINSFIAGICLYDSLTNKFLLEGAHYQSAVGGLVAIFTRYTSYISGAPGAYTALPIICPTAAYFRFPLYFRVINNGTNLITSYSSDGVVWFSHETRSRTDFLPTGPDEIGFAVNPDNATYDLNLLVEWFRVTTP